MRRRLIVRNKREHVRAAEIKAAFPTISFWFGIGPRELSQTPNNIIRMYLDALPSLIASWQHAQVEVVLTPHMKKQGYQQTVRKMSAAAGRLWKQIPLPEKSKNRPTRTAAEFKEQVAGLGFNVEIVPAAKPSPVEAKLPNDFGADD